MIVRWRIKPDTRLEEVVAERETGAHFVVDGKFVPKGRRRWYDDKMVALADAAELARTKMEEAERDYKYERLAAETGSGHRARLTRLAEKVQFYRDRFAQLEWEAAR